MTDDHEMDEPIDDVDDLDELLSAHLDAELELFEDRPDLDDELVAGRLSELRGAAEAVGASVPSLPPSVVDQQIAAALEALPRSSDGPTSLTAARARRQGRREQVLRFAASSAAVVVVVVFGFVVLAGLVSGISGDSDDDSGDTAEATSATVASSPFRGADDAAQDGALDGEADAATAEAAPEADLDESFEEPGEEAEETEDTEAPAEQEAPDDTEASAGDAAEGGLVDLPPVFDPALDLPLPDDCRSFLLSELDADDYLGANDPGDETLAVFLVRDGQELSVVIDPARCDGTDDPILDLFP
ncbi:MAG: hypothetical protein AAGA17_04605 [Actinomycetota bacterium]